jgi:ABC-type Fe3+/spermidine/putrescine transport system ATPase subunit
MRVMTVSSDQPETTETSPPGPSRTARVEVRDVNKTFVRSGGAEVTAVNDVDLTLYQEEILVLLGPSGCGKSTLLRCLAGLEHPDTGTITIGGETVFDSERRISLPPNERDVNMMFQSYALWPHMTLEANVAYPLRVEGEKKTAALRRANEYLELVGLGGLGKQYAGSVSGGQAQRAALARTLISEPAVALFDEPLSNVDAKVRARLRAELRRIHREVGFTAVYVTHDQTEAMGVASRIAVMREGRIAQLGDPVDVYETPFDRYAAQFIGEANLLDAEVVGSDGEHVTASTTLGPIRVPAKNFALVGIEPATGSAVTLMIRPEYLRVGREPTAEAGGANTWTARIESSVFAGSHTEYVCIADDVELLVWEMAAPVPLIEGDLVTLTVPAWAVRVVGSGS